MLFGIEELNSKKKLDFIVIEGTIILIKNIRYIKVKRRVIKVCLMNNKILKFKFNSKFVFRSCLSNLEETLNMNDYHSLSLFY